MSRRHGRGRRSGRRRGPIKRVVRGLANALGIPRGIVIAGFVLGFVFIPLPALLMFLVALYWVDNPERARRHADSVFDSLRRTGSRIRRSAAGAGPGSAAADPREPPRPHVDPASLARRFERAELRTRAIEEFVASEEFRLNREFRRMERD